MSEYFSFHMNNIANETVNSKYSYLKLIFIKFFIADFIMIHEFHWNPYKGIVSEIKSILFR